jgi:two-component system, chemotaxis family, chemotaxis protein CheY
MDYKAKILIADDSAFMRKILIDTLKNAGFSNFIEAENGNQALAKNTAEKPDLLLLDVIMPEKDGIEVVKEVGKTSNVIMVTAVGQDSIVKDANEAGAKGFIVKPFDKEKIISEVTRVLGIK